LIEPREAPLVFADELRLEAALAIARNLDRERPIVGQDRLAAPAVAMIRDRVGFLAARRLA
jgi:hypothetical protein